MDRKREVVVVPVSDVDRVEVFGQVPWSPAEIDGGRQRISRG